MLKLYNITMELSNVEKKKYTIKCDNRTIKTITYYFRMAQNKNKTVKCENLES